MNLLFDQYNFIYDDRIEWDNIDVGIKRKILAYDKNLMLVKNSFERNAIGAIHQHYHTQMSFIESGVFEVQLNREKQILRKGDVFFVPSNILHGVKCIEEGVLLDIFNPVREDFIADKEN